MRCKSLGTTEEGETAMEAGVGTLLEVLGLRGMKLFSLGLVEDMAVVVILPGILPL